MPSLHDLHPPQAGVCFNTCHNEVTFASEITQPGYTLGQSVPFYTAQDPSCSQPIKLSASYTDKIDKALRIAVEALREYSKVSRGPKNFVADEALERIDHILHR